MHYQNLDIYLQDLAAKKSVPGGGTAAALTAAQGVALLSMSCQFTTGKKGFEDVEGEIQDYLISLDTLRSRMFEGIEKDITAFESVMQQYRQKPIDQTALELSLKQATEVPLSLIQLCVSALPIQERLLNISNPNLMSDVVIGKHLLECAMLSSKENVMINLNVIKDQDYIQKTQTELTRLLQKISR